MLRAAENQFLSGRWRLARGEQMKGVFQLIYGAAAFGRFADPYRSIDGLVDAGAELLRLQQQGVDDPDRPGTTASYLTQLANALGRMRIGYRERDTARFAEWRTDASETGQ